MRATTRSSLAAVTHIVPDGPEMALAALAAAR
jgi:hypothetical protein